MKTSLVSAAIFATVNASKVFPYNRQWNFMTIPSGSVGVTDKYFQSVTVEVAIADAKSSTLLNFYMSMFLGSGEFTIGHVYQNYATFYKMSENELNNFVVCNVSQATATIPSTYTKTNDCGAGEITDVISKTNLVACSDPWTVIAKSTGLFMDPIK